MAAEQKNIFLKRGGFFKRHRPLIITSGVFIVLCLILVLTPVVLRHTFTDMLLKLGASKVSIEDVDFNLFSGELVIEKTNYTVPEYNPFNCGQITVNIDILPLLSGHIFLNNIVLDQCELSVKQPDSKTVVLNGFNVPLATQGDNQLPPPSEENSWQAGLHRLSISNVSLTYQDSKIKTEIYIDSLAINDVFPWEPDILSTASVNMKINGAPLLFEGSMRPFHRLHNLTGKLSITGLDFSTFSGALQSPAFALSNSLLTTQLEIKSILNDDNKYDVNISGFADNRAFKARLNSDSLVHDKLFWNGKLQLLVDSLDFSTSVFTDYDLVMDHFQYSSANQPWLMKIDSLSAKGQFSAAFDDSGGLLHPHAISKVSVNNVTLENPAAGLQVADIGSIDMDNLEMVNQQQIRLPSVKIRNAHLIGQAGDDIQSIGKRKNEQFLVNFTGLDVNDTKLDGGDKLTTASIQVADLDAQLVVSKDSSIRYLAQLQQTFSPAAPNAGDTGTAKTKSAPHSSERDAVNAPGAKPAIKIGIVETTGNSTFTFKDYSVKPYYQTNLRNMTLKLVSLDSTLAKNDTKISFAADVDESGSMQFDGTSQLFSPQLNTNVKGKIQNLELPAMSGYTLPVSGRKIKHGLLNATISVKIHNRKLDNRNELVLSNFSVIRDDDKLAKQYDANMPLPVEMAVDFLKDSKGRIELSVPVTGDLDNPQFNFMPAVASAIEETMQFAALSYIKYTLQPWGTMISIGELVAGKMSKITFDPLLFNPGSETIDARQKTYLDKIAKLMQDTPRLGLTVCGVATSEDKNIANGAAAQNPAAVPDQKALLALARQRAKAVTDYLTMQKKVSKKRLHSCNPTYYDQESAKPSVEFVF